MKLILQNNQNVIRSSSLTIRIEQRTQFVSHTDDLFDITKTISGVQGDEKGRYWQLKPEAVASRSPVKNLFWYFFQKSQENTCDGFFFYLQIIS